jgi:hypothetical protein
MTALTEIGINRKWAFGAGLFSRHLQLGVGAGFLWRVQAGNRAGL